MTRSSSSSATIITAPGWTMYSRYVSLPSGKATRSLRTSRNEPRHAWRASRQVSRRCEVSPSRGTSLMAAQPGSGDLGGEHLHDRLRAELHQAARQQSEHDDSGAVERQQDSDVARAFDRVGIDRLVEP